MSCYICFGPKVLVRIPPLNPPHLCLHKERPLMAIRRIVIAACILALSSAVLAQTLQGNIPVGSYPQAIAVNSFTDRIYALDEPSNQITEIDGVTNTTTAIPLGSNPQQSLYGALAINPFT